jgi:hypothetical protein
MTAPVLNRLPNRSTNGPERTVHAGCTVSVRSQSRATSAAYLQSLAGNYTPAPSISGPGRVVTQIESIRPTKLSSKYVCSLGTLVEANGFRRVTRRSPESLDESVTR